MMAHVEAGGGGQLLLGRWVTFHDESPSMITSCNCVSGGSGVCILCLFMHFAKVSLVEGLGKSHEMLSLQLPTTNWMTKCMGGRALGKRTHKHRQTTCWAFGFQSSVWIPGQNFLEFFIRIPSCSSSEVFGFRGQYSIWLFKIKIKFKI